MMKRHDEKEKRDNGSNWVEMTLCVVTLLIIICTVVGILVMIA